jgi:hypothetical protein
MRSDCDANDKPTWDSRLYSPRATLLGSPCVYAMRIILTDLNLSPPHVTRITDIVLHNRTCLTRPRRPYRTKSVTAVSAIAQSRCVSYISTEYRVCFGPSSNETFSRAIHGAIIIINILLPHSGRGVGHRTATARTRSVTQQHPTRRRAQTCRTRRKSIRPRSAT